MWCLREPVDICVGIKGVPRVQGLVLVDVVSVSFLSVWLILS